MRDYYFTPIGIVCSFFILFSFSYSIFRMLNLNYLAYATAYGILRFEHRPNFLNLGGKNSPFYSDTPLESEISIL